MISYKGNTPFVPLQHNQLEMTAVLEKVQEVLTSSREVQGSVLKATCDTLLSCATTYRSMKDIIQNHTFAVMVCRLLSLILISWRLVYFGYFCNLVKRLC